MTNQGQELVFNWPFVIKALWQIGLFGSPGLIFKGPTGAIKFEVNLGKVCF